MNRIIRTLDEQEYGLFHRYIFGLATLTFNGVRHSWKESPEAVFLGTLSNHCRCSGQIGAVSLDGGGLTPEAVFDTNNGPRHYFPTRVGFHDGFFDLNRLTVNKPQCIGGCTVQRTDTFGDSFFPRITPDFWRAIDTIPGFLYNHALVLYVSPTRGFIETTESMQRLLQEPFPGEEKWLRAVTEMYCVVLYQGHDGEYFHAWTQDAAHFALLDTPLSQAEAYIRNSPWYQRNKGQLVWAASPCLIPVRLPDG